MDALTLLTQQHDEAMDLFKQIEETEDEKKGRQLFTTLKAALELHEELEEATLYPRMKADEAFKDETLEAYEEHHVMDLLLREIDNLSAGSEHFKPKVKVLEENTKHHAKEEEEAKLFPMLRERWTKGQLDEVGAEMAQMMKSKGKTEKKAA